MTPLSVAPNTTDWITALSTLTLGALGLVFTIWQWRASGFRPKPTALLSGSGDSLRVEITNRGRGSGLIHHVAVTDAKGLAVAGTFRGLPDDAYQPRAVPAYGRMALTIEAPEEVRYSRQNRVVVAWGKRTKKLTPLPVDVSFFGLDPFLPPG